MSINIYYALMIKSLYYYFISKVLGLCLLGLQIG